MRSRFSSYFIFCLLLGALTLLISCSKDYSKLQYSCESMMNNYLMQDTMITPHGAQAKDLTITGQINDKTFFASKNRVLADFKIVDSYNNKELGHVFAKMGCDEIQLEVSGEMKLSVIVDSIFVDGKKIDKDTSRLNSVFFINNKPTHKELHSNITDTKENRNSITLKEYATDLYNAGMRNISITDDGILVHTLYQEPTGDPDFLAESIYREAKNYGVYDLRGVRVMRNGKVIGRYIAH